MLKRAIRVTEKIPAITAPLFMVLFGLVRLLSMEAVAEPEKSTSSVLPKLGLTREVVGQLPRCCRYANGSPMESMNVIIIGTKQEVRSLYQASGWYEALPVSLLTLFRAHMAIILNTQFLRGPVTPLYVGARKQRLAFQKPTALNKFRQRHHMRLWSTQFITPAGRPIWIGQASYDVDIKHIGSWLKFPVHQIDGDLDAEREVLRADLRAGGGTNHGYLRLQSAHRGSNVFNDEFTSDGRAFVIEAPQVNSGVQKAT